MTTPRSEAAEHPPVGPDRPVPARRPAPGADVPAIGAPATGVPGVVDRADGSRLVDAADRGSTVLADRVVEKIASRAALDIDHAGGLTRHIAGRPIGSATIRTRARIDGQIATLEMDLAVEYPAPVLRVTRAVREHVGETVARLCGLRVDHLDMNVAVLRRPETDTRRVR